MLFVMLLKFYAVLLLSMEIVNAKGFEKDANNEKLRVCVVEGRGNYKKAPKFCPILESESNIECIIGSDRLDCVRRIHKGSAHFGVFSAEDLVAARWASVEILVTNEMRFHNSPFEYEVVAVVDRESNIHTPHDLRGKKFCHPGHGLENHWTEILANYFESLLIPKSCEPELSLVESRIKASANFFGPACKAGPWVPDPLQDRVLKNRYPSLCEICYDSYRCGSGDKHWGRRGTLYCLTSGSGDVSWARLDDVRSHFGYSGLQAEANPEEYNLLCPDGHLQPINTTNPCVWVAKPWPAIAARRSHAAKIQEIVSNISHDDKSWKNALLSLLETYHVNITSLDNSIPIDDYLDQATGFQSAYSFSACNPPRSIIYCTTSIISHTKCSWLQEAASVYGIEPNIQCIRAENLDRCLDDTRHKAADVVLVDQDIRLKAQKMYNLRPILYEFSRPMYERYVVVGVVKEGKEYKTIKDFKNKKACFPSFEGAAHLSVLKAFYNTTGYVPDIHDYFASDSCTWNPEKGKNCPQHYYGDEGALRCLVEGGGDIAFISYEVYKNFTTGSLNSTWHKSFNPQEFSLFCPYGKIPKKAKYDFCYFHWTPRGHLMINNQTSIMRRNEIYNSLRDMDKLFGKQSKSYTLPFTMFGPFDKRNDIMFRDNTEGLRGIVELKKDKAERLLEEAYYDYANKRYMFSSASILRTSQLIMLISIFVIKFLR